MYKFVPMKNTSAKKLQKAIALGVTVIATLAVGALAQQGRAGNLGDVTVTLSNSRPSFSGEVGSGNNVGSTVLTIDNSGPPSANTNQLVIGDILYFSTVSGNDYSVVEILDSETVRLDDPLQSGDQTAAVPIYDPQVTTISVAFTTVTAILDGSFEILIPIAAANNNDGAPDQGGFDIGNFVAGDVTCPGNAGNHAFGSAAVTTTTLGGNDYVQVTCPYTGAGSIGEDFTIAMDDLVNPAPQPLHASGTADPYTITIRHLDTNDNVIDSTGASVGIIEAVRVTATVEPQLNFDIIGINDSTSVCGVSTDVTTTPYAVPFGDLSLSAFADAAQTLQVSTNGSGGYVVTAIANDQLSKNGQGCTNTDPVTNTDTDCIQDARGDTSTMTHAVVDEFSNVASKGFAYSLVQNSVTGNTTVDFQYNNSTGGCTGAGWCGKQFADLQGQESPQSLFYSTTVSDNESVDVCYRVIPDTSTEAGDYSNFIIYTATATF